MTSSNVVLALSGPDSPTRPGPNGSATRPGADAADQRAERMLERDTDGGTGPRAPVLAYVLVAAGEHVHVVPTAGGAESPRHDAPALSLETVAALLERAAASLRDGSGQAPHSVPRTVESVHRAPAAAAAPERLHLGHLEILPATRLVLRQGEPVPLSRIEFDLFLALVRRGGRPATRLELVREVWGFGAAVTSRSVDTQIYNLRHKLEENPGNPRHLLTVSGVGYRVVP